MIDIIKTFSIITSAYAISELTTDTNEFPDSFTMMTMIVGMFIIFINFINFLKYVIVTQKLIIVIIQIIKDLG